jgi:spore germination cell wall hydrolase CwlJ-like protein
MKYLITIFLLFCNLAFADQITKEETIKNLIKEQRDRNLNFNLKEYEFELTELECLALTVYHEARGEGETGIKAVAFVIHNRVTLSRRMKSQGAQKPYWGVTYCDTVYQDNQFSFINDNKNDSVLYFHDYEKILRICYDLMYNGGFLLEKSPVGKSYFFHSLEKPKDWMYHSHYDYVATLGNHHFFTFKGEN